MGGGVGGCKCGLVFEITWEGVAEVFEHAGEDVWGDAEFVIALAFSGFDKAGAKGGKAVCADVGGGAFEGMEVAGKLVVVMFGVEVTDVLDLFWGFGEEGGDDGFSHFFVVFDTVVEGVTVPDGLDGDALGGWWEFLEVSWGLFEEPLFEDGADLFEGEGFSEEVIHACL